jgi:chemotaxis protein methyltransferase CheR
MKPVTLHAAGSSPPHAPKGEAPDAGRRSAPVQDARLTPPSIGDIEIDLLLEGIFRAHGVDLRRVRRPAVQAAILRLVHSRGLRSVTALLEEVLHHGESGRSLQALLCQIDLFADPGFFAALRNHVIPWLRTYPYSAIWAAESGTGADVYALAILLEEAGVYDRIRIYATQRDAARLALLDAGIASALALELGEVSYREAGGERSLADYYEPHGEALQVKSGLRRNIVWAEYDLRAGETFNEFDLILCRNVIPSLRPEEQRRVYRLMAQSLSRFGLLALGEDEKPDVAPYAAWFRAWQKAAGLHQRVR